MDATEPQRLLQDYLKTGSNDAFSGLVQRYVSLVYSSALRRTGGNAHLAQDITQVVFADLARLAKGLSREPALGGWLHRHTCFVANTVMRSERRRTERETNAAEMNALQNGPEPDWGEVAPVLDEAIQKLNRKDRDAIVLRYFERLDFRQVGQSLGLSDDAAQKRVGRALDKLRQILVRSGAAISTGALAAILSGPAITAAPASLSAAACATASAGIAAGTGLSLTLINILTMTKLKLAATGAIAAAGIAVPLVFQQHLISGLREQNEVLAVQAGIASALASENSALSNRLAQSQSGRNLSGTERLELMRLRGEVGLLRRESQELARLRTAASTNAAQAPAARPQARPYLPAEAWANVGTSTPETAFQTFLWAARHGDTNLVRNLIRWRKEDSVPEFEGLDSLMESLVPASAILASEFHGMRVVSQKMESDTSARMRVEFTGKDGKAQPAEIQFARTEDEWTPVMRVFSQSKGSIQASFETPSTPELDPVE